MSYRTGAWLDQLAGAASIGRLPVGILALFLAGPLSARAQGTLVFHNTGSGQTLDTELRSLFVDPGLQQARLVFDFGFATEEAVAPGAFLDSFTVSIQDGAQQFTSVFLTADASGVVWAPNTPGAVSIDPGTISAVTVAYPGLQPTLPNQSAFEVSAAIPAQFLGGTINVSFDLFDNGDTKISQGWFSDLRVQAVPEPECVGFGILAGGLLVLRRLLRA